MNEAIERTALEEHCSRLQNGLRSEIANIASKFPRDVAIANLLEVAAHLEFEHHCRVPENENVAWTNGDFKRACERLIERLQAIVDNTPRT
jgi:hypothetical protein